MDLEEKLVSALEKIDKLMKQILKQNDQLQKYERKDHDHDKIEKTILNMKTHLEEAKMIDQVVRGQLKEKQECFEKLEYEVVSLRERLEKSNTQL